jgi:hypothetical protein
MGGRPGNTVRHPRNTRTLAGAFTSRNRPSGAPSQQLSLPASTRHGRLLVVRGGRWHLGPRGRVRHGSRQAPVTGERQRYYRRAAPVRLSSVRLRISASTPRRPAQARSLMPPSALHRPKDHLQGTRTRRREKARRFSGYDAGVDK